VEMRKPHPCGSTMWTVNRIGADIGLTCVGCGRRIMLPRRVLMKRMKQIAHADSEGGTTPQETRSKNEWSSE
ncbi:MAG: DUF951 domain-containing protein, partial [Anaerolineae bacterium]|nr:DUF951 domain-containing protein [Anaerolineae bacterium]